MTIICLLPEMSNYSFNISSWTHLACEFLNPYSKYCLIPKEEISDVYFENKGAEQVTGEDLNTQWISFVAQGL